MGNSPAVRSRRRPCVRVGRLEVAVAVVVVVIIVVVVAAAVVVVVVAVPVVIVGVAASAVGAVRPDVESPRDPKVLVDRPDDGGRQVCWRGCQLSVREVRRDQQPGSRQRTSGQQLKMGAFTRQMSDTKTVISEIKCRHFQAISKRKHW